MQPQRQQISSGGKPICTDPPVLAGAVGTLEGHTQHALLVFLQRITSFIRFRFQGQSCAPSCLNDLARQPDYVLAAMEQEDWLAELNLLQLANDLQRCAISLGGYDDRAFDLMIAISDLLEAHHGWSLEQSEAWLARMGLWEKF